MIKIESITIHEIRGIRDLTVEPNRENFLVLGPNGSGKSGVVDAIQFALTGGMSRLAGTGTAGLSLRSHGPHVDSNDNPSAAQVSLRFYVPELQESAVLTRSVMSPKKFCLQPDDPNIRATMNRLALHPELSLSRREITKYIIVESGQRSKEIQALLKLDEIGNTRRVLMTAFNRLTNSHTNAEERVENANAALRRHLDVEDITKKRVLSKVNVHRVILGLDELSDVTDDTDLGVGIQNRVPQQAFDKASALRDVEALEKEVVNLPALCEEEAEILTSDLAILHADPELLQAIERRSFVLRGLELVDGTYCPLCDTEWEDEESLRGHLKDKLLKADKAESLHSRLLHNASLIANQAIRISGIIQAVLAVVEADHPAGLLDELEGWSTSLETLESKLKTVESIRTQQDRFAGEWAKPPPSIGKHLKVLKDWIQDKPDQNATIVAQKFLTLAQDRLEALREAQSGSKHSETAVRAARTIYETYCVEADAHLCALYDDVADEFGSYYRRINAEDEGEFRAKLEPAESALDLEVAFYDKGMFPPGAYHSEGHQDGMGVCLYLALMKRLLGNQFSFVVLDDVVMSVDQGHRKELCRLLKKEFPDTQFIITTHDKVWAKQMETVGLVKPNGGVAFHSWSVQTGPIIEQTPDIWEKIDADIAKGELGNAAARLRRHMEYVSGELADCLAATPRYRGDFSYDLGDLLPAVIGRHGVLLKRAAAAANSWKDPNAQATVEAMKRARSEALKRYGGEAWVVNKALHWNEWENLDSAEFREVVEAFACLLGQFKCTNEDCVSWINVTPKKGVEETLRCYCGDIIVNLKSK